VHAGKGVRVRGRRALIGGLGKQQQASLSHDDAKLKHAARRPLETFGADHLAKDQICGCFLIAKLVEHACMSILGWVGGWLDPKMIAPCANQQIISYPLL
jgi:hypothetical protein